MSDKFDGNNSPGYWDKYWIQDKKHNERWGTQKLVEIFKKSNAKSLLDIGCGHGMALTQLKREGYRYVFGADISPNAIERLNRGNVEGWVMSAYDIDEIDRTFDFVSSVHLLEHLERDEEFLYKCKDRLNVGGTCFVGVPDDMSYPEPTGEHTRKYDEKQLMELMKNIFGNAETGTIGNHLFVWSKKLDFTDTKIDFCTTTVDQELIDGFLKTFLATTKKYKNVTLKINYRGDIKIPELPNVTTVPSIAKHWNKDFNPVIKEGLEKGHYAWGWLADDMLFVDGWLEDILTKLQLYEGASAGYVEGRLSDEKFREMVEKTKYDSGVIPMFTGTIMVTRMDIFRTFMMDENYEWGSTDLDLGRTMTEFGMKSVTCKRITVNHFLNASRSKNPEAKARSKRILKQDFTYFRHKWGGMKAIRDFLRPWKKDHDYFTQLTR